MTMGLQHEAIQDDFVGSASANQRPSCLGHVKGMFRSLCGSGRTEGFEFAYLLRYCIVRSVFSCTARVVVCVSIPSLQKAMGQHSPTTGDSPWVQELLNTGHGPSLGDVPSPSLCAARSSPLYQVSHPSIGSYGGSFAVYLASL